MLPKTGATRPVAGTRARRHVATHRARRHRETELHAKFGRDALLTPRAIRGGHLDDEAPEGDSCRVIDAWGGPRIRYRTRACLRGNKFSAASCARDRKVDRDSRKRSVSRASTVRITCEEISGDGQVPGAVDELAQPVSVALLTTGRGHGTDHRPSNHHRSTCTEKHASETSRLDVVGFFRPRGARQKM